MAVSKLIFSAQIFFIELRWTASAKAWEQALPGRPMMP
jgi:hypothetical protein